MFTKRSNKTVWGTLFSRAGSEVLRYLAEHPGEPFHERELARRTGVSSAGAHKALKVLRALGLVDRERRGRMYLYRLREDRPLVRPLKAFFTVFSLEPLVKALGPIASLIILYGSASRGEQTSDSDVDLFVVSRHEARVRTLVNRLRGGRSLQVVIKTPEEWAVLEDKDLEFFREVLRGIVLWERPMNESAL